MLQSAPNNINVRSGHTALKYWTRQSYFLTAVSFKGDKRYVERRGVKHISEIGCICNLQRIKAANGCVQFSVGFSYSLVIISAKYNIKLRFGLTGLEIGSGLGLGFGLGIGIRLNLYWT